PGLHLAGPGRAERDDVHQPSGRDRVVHEMVAVPQPQHLHRPAREGGTLCGRQGRIDPGSLRRDRAELSLAELCRRTGLPSSTAHRLAAELLRHQILERSATGRYLVGIRLWEISARSLRSSGLRESAMPFLQEFYDATQEHVQLAVLDGDDALII